MNDNVIYIDYLESYLDITNEKVPQFLRKIIYKMCNYCGIVKQKNNYLQIICQEEDIINQKMLKNILKKIKRSNLKNIVLAERLEKNEEFKKIIKSTNCKILDGTWLYRFLAYDIVNKIAYIQNTKIGEMEITILLAENSEITNK